MPGSMKGTNTHVGAMTCNLRSVISREKIVLKGAKIPPSFQVANKMAKT